MDRRRFLLISVAGAVAAPFAAGAQEAGKVWRIGFLGFTSPGIESRAIGALKTRLEELGYVDDKNVSIVYRWADWDRLRYPALARELVRLGVDVITVPCGWGLQAVRRASPTVPVAARCIGLREMGAEIRDGNQPTAFTTGVTYFVPDAITRRLEIVRELFPHASRIALLYRPESDWARHLGEVESAARQLRFQVDRIAWRSDAELPFGVAQAAGHDVVLPLSDGWTVFRRDRLVELINERRLAAVYDFRAFVTSGGLASYGPDVTDVYQKVANQIARILAGKRAADMPIERPSGSSSLSTRRRRGDSASRSLPPCCSGRIR